MPDLRWRLLHLLALASLSITQPLLSVLGENPTFFTAHDSSAGQIFWFALIVAIAPAATAALVEVGAHLVRPRAGELVHLALLGGLGVLFFVQLFDFVPGPWAIAALLAVGAAAGTVLLYQSRPAVRSVFSVLAASSLVFVASFLFVSPTNALVFPDDVEATDLGAELDALVRPETPSDENDTDDVRSVRERLNERFPSIYLLILDELPMASLLNADGVIDAERWPNFARLADTSHLFSNATTIGFTTERAVPGILTGQNETYSAPVYSFYPQNIFTLLGNVYDVSESDPLVQLCPPSLCNDRPPDAIRELLTEDTSEPASDPAPSTVAPAPSVDSPSQTATSDNRGLRLLFDDAAIVFGHIAAPEGLGLGLPEIGSSWGSFGDDGPLRVESQPSSPDEPPIATTTTTTVPLDFVPGEAPEDDIVFVDSEAIRSRNEALLEDLILNDTRLRDFDRDLDAIQLVEAPTLQVVHSLLPHVPWRFHADGQIYDDVRLPGYTSSWDNEPTTARAAQQRHLLQLAFVDQLLGRYLDQLESSGMFDRSTVIVTADHGIAFNAGSGARGLDEANAGGIVGVPLFYKLPGQTNGEQHEKPVQTIDIVPTIAAQLDIEIPWTIHGGDLFGPEIERSRDVLHPFPIEVAEPWTDFRDAVTADLLDFFGDGTSGSFYALAGMQEQLGTDVSDQLGRPASYCWVRERPDMNPDENGALGFVFGHLRSSRSDRVPFAILVDGVLAGTSWTLDAEHLHRVYGLGDPDLWHGAALDDITIAEIDGEQLRPIRLC